MPVTTRTQDDHPIFNLRRVVLRDHKSRTRISIPITREFSQAPKVKSSSKDPLSEQSLKALRNVRAALKEYNSKDEQPRFKASPSRSSDSTEEEKSWVWSDSSLEVETDSSSSKSSEKPGKKSSSKSSSSEKSEESSSSSETKESSKSSPSSSEEEAEEEVVLGDKYKSFPREWLVSFQRDYPKTGLPAIPDTAEK